MTVHMLKGMELEALNAGYVKLVDFMGSDLAIARSARVSYAADWRAGEDTGSDKRLINYLMKNGHNTPFESCEMQFEVKLPIFVARQWMRHRTQSFNEVSARYTKLPDEFFIPDHTTITKQSKDNKQMRDGEELPNSMSLAEAIMEASENSFKAYDKLLSEGCPRELARCVLPVGAYTKFFAKANLHNWFRFLKERLHPHAQHEIREYAEQVLWFTNQLFPVATEAFIESLPYEINNVIEVK